MCDINHQKKTKCFTKVATKSSTKKHGLPRGYCYLERLDRIRLSPIARNRVATSKLAREQVMAPYLRTDFDFLDQRLKIVAGVRGEKTKVHAEGPLTDPKISANGIERGSRIEKSYDKLYPSLNASYSIRENLIARLAAYESIGRPDYNQYAGGLTLPDTSAGDSATNRIFVNNVDIKPWAAKSLVMRLEHYFQGVGVVSVAAFRRDVQNFFGSTVQAATPEFLASNGLDPNAYNRYGVSTQYNIPGTVRFQGVSFNYRQSLTFLPIWAQGFEVFTNGTIRRAVVPRAYGITREVQSNIPLGARFAGLADGRARLPHAGLGGESKARGDTLGPRSNQVAKRNTGRFHRHLSCNNHYCACRWTGPEQQRRQLCQCRLRS